MKILKSNLLSVIANPARIAKSKSTLPILKTIRIEAVNGVFTATGNSLDEYCTAATDCDGELAPCCIYEDKLASLLPLLPDEIEMVLDKQLILNGDFKLSIQDAFGFPVWKKDGSVKMGVPCGELAEAIKATSWAAPVHDGRPVLYASHIKCTPKTIMVEATNGRELAQCTKNLIAVDMDCCVPVPFIRNFREALAQDGAVLSLSPNIATVEFDGGEYGCKLSEHKYLDTKLAFTKKTPLGEIHVDKWKPLFQSAISINGIDNKLRCAVLVSEHFEYVGVNGSISPKTPEPITSKEPLKLNAIPFLDCLNAFTDEPVKLSVMENTTLCMEQADLTVLTLQLR